MATNSISKKSTTKTAPRKLTPKPAAQPVAEPVVEKVVEKRKFADDDMITCVSITPGEMFFEGARTKDLYIWADFGYDTEIAYADLKYAARSRNKMMYKPRFIVQDEDFLAEFPELEALYGEMYTTSDLMNILKLPAGQLRTEIVSLPVGAQEALKVMVSTMIDSGELDSASRIKVFDEIFGTEMLLKLTGI